MLSHLKPGAGRFLGDDYQFWIGVLIILDWFDQFQIDENHIIWLREEIGVKKYGIFDDIQVKIDDKFTFYQVKSSSSNKGDYPDENILLDSNEDLYIKKIYDSYSKIKKVLGENVNFKLIISHERTIINVLNDIIDQYSFHLHLSKIQ